MLYEDEDDIFMGSPKSKFFDIVFHANPSLVKEKILEIVERYSAMELLLEEFCGDEANAKIDAIVRDRADEIMMRNNDFFITTVAKILTHNE